MPIMQRILWANCHESEINFPFIGASNFQSMNFDCEFDCIYIIVFDQIKTSRKYAIWICLENIVANETYSNNICVKS